MSDCSDVTCDEIISNFKFAKRNKACGIDEFFYESIIHGGLIIASLAAKLFTLMLKTSYTPDIMKKGSIITLHKGGSKSKLDPNNYRAITLSSVLLKLYERVLLTRIERSGQVKIHALQGGFQKNSNCLMTSFLVREGSRYAREHNSKLYIAFLDVRKAFDTVWHDALRVMLYNTGIDKYIYKAIDNLYINMTSCVKGPGHNSDWFKVLEGTRQGGVLSPFLFLVFTNNLLNM